MGDGTKDSTGGQPPFDPHKLLGQLKEFVTPAGGATTKDGGKSWVGALIAIVVVLVGVAVWSWISMGRNRELAKLRHEKNKAKILNDQAVVDQQVAKGEEQIAAAQREVEQSEERIRAIEADLRAGEARYEADLRAIDSIRSWRDAGVR